MAKSKYKRKLTAILSADVVGYSRLMGDNEEFTIQTLNTCRELITTLIEDYRGRVVDAVGDNLLAEFTSAVDAIQCAVAIQIKLKKQNEQLPKSHQMLFRIGINIGDVVHENGNIYGDGVNITARIEGLADPGGVCISWNTYDHIKNKLKLGYEYTGEHAVKNIKDPVRVYRVLMNPEDAGKLIDEEQKLKAHKWILPAVVAAVIVLTLISYQVYQKMTVLKFEPASMEKMTYPLPDKASIAVLPFVNMSDDPKQEYFSDGITESIIMVLSKVRDMFVIARNSTFTYKGKAVKIQQIAEELGVRYVLQGSVQTTEGRVRITAQLIDAITGKHMWVDRYDRELKDLFVLQDEITIKIITALQVQLTEGVELTVGTNNLDAYLKFLQACEQTRRGNKEGNAMGRKLIEETIALDPEFADAYLKMSATHLMDMMYGSSESPEQSLKLAEEFVQKAISLRGAYSDAHAFLGRIYLTKGKYNEAITEGERAVALNPDSAFVNAALAYSLGYAGRPEDAIVLYKKAIRLSPISDLWFLGGLGFCYRMTGRYEEAISEYKKVIKRSSDSVLAHLGAAAAYSLWGHEKEAQTEAVEILRINPQFSLESYRKGQLYKDPKELERSINALRKAGLPE